VGQAVLASAKTHGYDVPELAHYLPLVQRILQQADLRVLQGIQVPADEKLYSLFESHTELIKRGKAGKAIEFGHKVLVAQTGEKFIHHYEVMEKRREDKDLLRVLWTLTKHCSADCPTFWLQTRGSTKT
jgi:IS5 family transposase